MELVPWEIKTNLFSQYIPCPALSHELPLGGACPILALCFLAELHDHKTEDAGVRNKGEPPSEGVGQPSLAIHGRVAKVCLVCITNALHPSQRKAPCHRRRLFRGRGGHRPRPSTTPRIAERPRQCKPQESEMSKLRGCVTVFIGRDVRFSRNKEKRNQT